MIKKLVVSTLAAGVLSTAAFAGQYVGAGLAYEKFNEADAGVALVLNGGATLDNLDLGPGKLAVESEFSYSVVSPSYEYSYSGYGYSKSFSIDFTVLTLAGYAAYIYDVTPEFYVKPRIGLVYKSASVSSSSGGGYGVSDSAIGIAFGAGAGYKLTEDIDLYGDFTLIEGTDIMHITGGVSYHFANSLY